MAARTGLTSMIQGHERPLIWIARSEYRRLLTSLDEIAARAPDVSRFLEAELERAILCSDHHLPSRVVRMGTRIHFRRDDDAPLEWGLLCYPDRTAPQEGRIAIGSPLGAALLGLREGAAMPYRDEEGCERLLRVERVVPLQA